MEVPGPDRPGPGRSKNTKFSDRPRGHFRVDRSNPSEYTEMYVAVLPCKDEQNATESPEKERTMLNAFSACVGIRGTILLPTGGISRTFK